MNIQTENPATDGCNGAPLSSFIDAIRGAGLEPPADFIIDEQIHRFSTNGDKNDLAGYYCLFDHGEFKAGFFGCWRSGHYEIWTSRSGSSLTPDQRLEYREKIEKAKADADIIRKAEAEAAAVEAKRTWDQAKAAPAEHPYLLNKKINPHGLRIEGDALLVPVMDPAGNILSLQRIFPNGEKRFLTGGTVKGGFFRIPGNDATIYICEGFATGATIHEISGATVYIAFNAGNLLPAAKAIKRAMI